jgi:type IV secretory pathway VirJ component
MRWRAESATAVLLVLLVAGAACGPALSPSRRDLGRLANVRLFVPAEERDGFVFLFSDAQGWRPPLDDAARDLVRNGIVVVGIDLPSMLERLAASDDGCHYVVADLEDASRRLELEFGFPAFRAPVLAGVGVGATLAYAALAQSPAATIGGALGRPRGPALPTRVPLCAGARATKVTGGYTYEPSAALPGWLAPPPAPDATGKEIAAVVSEAMLAAAGESRTTLAHLPLAEIPSDEPGDLLAVIFSGDGGWRDLDKTIGEDLAKHGVAVVGVDSLRYFWTERTPERVAADTTRIIEHYGARWDREHVILIGYSFGAGILPFVVTRLPAETRARVVEVSLLGLEAVASFEFHVGEWLGMKDPTARPILPELEKIDPSLVQCVYGVEETDSICPTPQLGAIERIRTTGGHHFDGDYARLAKRILDGARRRAAPRPDRDLDMSGADG